VDISDATIKWAEDDACSPKCICPKCTQDCDGPCDACHGRQYICECDYYKLEERRKNERVEDANG